MLTRGATATTPLLLAGALTGTLAAQAPPVANAPLTRQPGAALATTFNALLKGADTVRWIGYHVPAIQQDRGTGLGDRDCCGSCRLEPSSDRGAAPSSQERPAVVRLEPSQEMTVLFRADGNRVERVRIFPADCQLDAGGRPVIWLENVRPSESIGLLESLATDNAGSSARIRDGAIAALALHADSAADDSLERLTSVDQPEAVRRKVTFWLGHARGTRGLERLRQMLRDDPSLEVRRQAVFGVAQSAAPGALEALISTAREHREPAVRSQAVFWLGQKAGRKVAEAITERIEQDPDTEVKKRAVFALSQFPQDEGVPLLIEVARKNANPAVRKQAMFWLAQSGDPRAIEFFAEILR